MKSITGENLRKFREETEKCEKIRTLQGALAQSEYNKVAFLPAVGERLNEEFSYEIKTRGVTDQLYSGRCWLFSAMNIIREKAMDSLGVDSFELSGNYLAFYDKLEKCNNFLQTVIDNADKPLNDRMNEYILGGIEDNGYFDMARDLINKYGVVPASVMPMCSGICGMRSASMRYVFTVVVTSCAFADTTRSSKPRSSQCWTYS